MFCGTKQEAIVTTPKPTSEPDYTKAMKSDVKQESGFHAGPHHHGIRGLANLGNTCFFNSVMQNLLALKMLREYLLNRQNSDPDNNVTFVTGPLTMSLRKLFLETNGEEDCKGVLSPKSLFGNICAKAPQFRGYQQQDSHELLRYLLDGLNTEETSARKLKQADPDKGGGADTAGPTLVDSMFSGRLSSTVSCLDCGYTSVVHEPFLDLSLPVPAKKTSTVAKKGGNRPPLVRGRGRSQRFNRPASRSSAADEEKARKHKDATENTSFKAAGETSSTVSKAGEMSDPKSTFIEAGADISEEIPGSKEVDGSGSGAGPESTAVDVGDNFNMGDNSWMDFIANQDSDVVAQEPSEAESSGPEVLGSDSTAPELQQRGSTVIAAGETGLKQCTEAEAEPEVAIAVAETCCLLGNDDSECRMRLEGSLQELDPVKQEITVSESTVVEQGAEGLQNISSEADTSCSAMVIGKKNIEVGVDNAKELTGSKADTGGSSSGNGHTSMHEAGPSCSMESRDSTNGSILKVDNESSPCVSTDKWESTLSANISDKPDSAFLSLKVVDDSDLLPDQQDKTKSMDFDAKVNHANTSSSFVGSHEQELVLKGNIVKVDGDNGWLHGEYEEVEGLKVKADDDIGWLHDQGDELNGMDLKANVQDDTDWLMDEGSEIHGTVVKTRVHAYSEAESYGLESTIIKVDDYVPGSMAFKESIPLCMDVAGSGSKPASPNQRLTSTNSDSQDRCGDSIIETSGLPDSNPTKDESADSSITQEDAKPETDTNTSTSIDLHPPENTNEIKTDSSTVNVETVVQQEEEFDGFGDMFNEPEEAIGPVNRPGAKPEDEDDADSIFWGSGTFSGFGFNNEEVDDTDKPVSVVSCLELFTKPELLTGEHAWHCEKCSASQSNANDQDCRKGDEKQKVTRDAIKRYLVDRAPQVLTVHLKRFSQDARGRLSKLRGHVNFEEILDFTPYVRRYVI